MQCQAVSIILLFAVNAVLSALLGNQSKTRMLTFFRQVKSSMWIADMLVRLK